MHLCGCVGMHVKSSLQRASGASTAGRGCQKAIDVVDRFFHDLLDKELLFFLALPDVVDKEGLAVGIRACRPRAALKVCPGRGPTGNSRQRPGVASLPD